MEHEKTISKTHALILIIALATLAVTVFAGLSWVLETSLSFGHGNGAAVNVELHMWVKHYRNGRLLSQTYHAMTLTNFGKNWIADNLGKNGGDNVTKFATYIGCSNDTGTPGVAWVNITDEITTDGLERANGTWADTGNGTWNITKSFSVTGTNSTKLYGLYIDSYANYPRGGLVAAEQQGVGSQKNLLSGDTLAVTIQGTIS